MGKPTGLWRCVPEGSSLRHTKLWAQETAPPSWDQSSMSPQVRVRERNRAGLRRNRQAQLPTLIHWSEMQSAQWSRWGDQKDNAGPSAGNCWNAGCQHRALPSVATWRPTSFHSKTLFYSILLTFVECLMEVQGTDPFSPAWVNLSKGRILLEIKRHPESPLWVF